MNAPAYDLGNVSASALNLAAMADDFHTTGTRLMHANKPGGWEAFDEARTLLRGASWYAASAGAIDDANFMQALITALIEHEAAVRQEIIDQITRRVA